MPNQKGKLTKKWSKMQQVFKKWKNKWTRVKFKTAAEDQQLL